MIAPVCAQAQIFQNSDMYYLVGPSFAGTQAIGNGGVTLYSSVGYAWTWGFGHQFKRVGGASLWFDVPLTFINPSHQTATIPGSISLGSTMVIPDLRLMLPLASRISVFACAGAGVGFFDYPVIESSNPLLTANSIDHGVFAFGGGVDFRLSRVFSLRLDVRDYVTGRDLGGVPGRNHLLPVFGFVFH